MRFFAMVLIGGALSACQSNAPAQQPDAAADVDAACDPTTNAWCAPVGFACADPGVWCNDGSGACYPGCTASDAICCEPGYTAIGNYCCDANSGTCPTSATEHRLAIACEPKCDAGSACSGGLVATIVAAGTNGEGYCVCVPSGG